IDQAGNAEAAPASADATVVVDATAPSSSASAPALASSSLWTVSYAAADPGAGASGLQEVDLWAKAQGDSAYSRVGSVGLPHPIGTFRYPVTAGPGSHRFSTAAIDKAGNAEAPASAPDGATTVVDTVPPVSSASAPALTSSSAWTVSYTAADPGTGASGL